nr:YigZ family protein [Aminobacter aminovorans]
MFTLAQPETFAQDIKKSRFLAAAGPVADEVAAKAFVAAHSDAGANHNCWAWRIGQSYRFSDDGEPSGTAGKPILAALDGQHLDNVAVVVTRWFGGILLGSGGLVRAYGGTAAACLRAAAKTEIVISVEAKITCGFADLAIVQARLAAQSGVRIVAETFTANGAELKVALPEADVETIVRKIADLTSGRAIVALPD